MSPMLSQLQRDTDGGRIMREMSLWDIATDWVDSRWMPPFRFGGLGCYGWTFA